MSGEMLCLQAGSERIWDPALVRWLLGGVVYCVGTGIWVDLEPQFGSLGTDVFWKTCKFRSGPCYCCLGLNQSGTPTLARTVIVGKLVWGSVEEMARVPI